MSSPNIKTAMARTICVRVSAEISSIMLGAKKKIVSVNSEGKLLIFRHKWQCVTYQKPRTESWELAKLSSICRGEVWLTTTCWLQQVLARQSAA